VPATAPARDFPGGASPPGVGEGIMRRHLPWPASMPFATSEHYAVLTAMITPAFFLTATGSLLISSNGRLMRVVDRMREDLARMKVATPGPERDQLTLQVAVHRRRSALVLLSLRLLYASMSAFVGTSLAIAINSLTGHRLDFLPVVLAILGVLLMFGASVCLGREARLGLKMLNDELDAQIDRNGRGT
jgi:flagellar biosynthesis protein FliQ